MNVRTFNVEADLPSLDEARRRVIEEIRRAKHESVRVLKSKNEFDTLAFNQRLGAIENTHNHSEHQEEPVRSYWNLGT